MPELAQLKAEIDAIQKAHWVGRTSDLSGALVTVTGLARFAALGDVVEITPVHGKPRFGEVLALGEDGARVLPDGGGDGLSIGDPVYLRGRNELAPDQSWLGRIIDPYGRAIDESPMLRGRQPRPVLGTPISPTDRRSLGERVETGLAIFNTMLPIVRGQRVGLFAGTGVGKSTLLGRLATGIEADVVVIALIGERGREVREFAERVIGPAGMRKTIIVAATADQSAMMRRRCAWTAMTVAEHFRDQGAHVLFVADSVTRFAEAHRQVALSAGEPGTLRGYPPSTASMITELCERAGPGGGGSGDITAIFNVLVAGSDMEEPIADILRGVLDGHVVLDREIAERGRFPAIDLLRSVSRALPAAASEEENGVIGKARRLLGAFEHHEMMIRAGLYTKGSDPEIDAAIEVWPKLDAFVAERLPTREAFQRLAVILDPPPPEPAEGAADAPGTEITPAG